MGIFRRYKLYDMIISLSPFWLITINVWALLAIPASFLISIPHSNFFFCTLYVTPKFPTTQALNKLLSLSHYYRRHYKIEDDDMRFGALR